MPPIPRGDKDGKKPPNSTQNPTNNTQQDKKVKPNKRDNGTRKIKGKGNTSAMAQPNSRSTKSRSTKALNPSKFDSVSGVTYRIRIPDESKEITGYAKIELEKARADGAIYIARGSSTYSDSHEAEYTRKLLKSFPSDIERPYINTVCVMQNVEGKYSTFSSDTVQEHLTTTTIHIGSNGYSRKGKSHVTTDIVAMVEKSFSQFLAELKRNVGQPIDRCTKFTKDRKSVV